MSPEREAATVREFQREAKRAQHVNEEDRTRPDRRRYASTDPPYKAGYAAARKKFERDGEGRGSQTLKPVACETCGAADSRDAAHARGCPKLEPLTQEQLIALARSVEAGWASMKK